jgi:VCBS repeat-containing protein
MSFSTESIKSVSSPRILIELDISSINSQWVNAGAGIWKVNFDNIYPEVDATLLDGFTVQLFDNIGSCTCDNTVLSKVNTLLEMSSTYQSFYYDGSTKTLYVSLPNYDEPFIHTILIGVVYGLSKEEFTPVGASQLYEGRLSTVPSLGYTRDPLYFGKIAFESANIKVINADGYFDTFADTFNIYGNAVRIYFGYASLPYSEYELIYSGYIETIQIAEDYMTITSADNRKKLTTKVHYTVIDINALDALVVLLQMNNPSISYNDTFFNTAEWDIARALVPNITITMDNADSTDEILKLIEGICLSCFGLFTIQPDGRYTFKLLDTSATSVTSITKYDILSDPLVITYDPTQVLSSIKITYDKVDDENIYGYQTTLTDTSHEAYVYNKYKVYVENDFESYLINSITTQALADKIMAYAMDVHGTLPVTVPMKYYNVSVGDNIDIEINRENSVMLGYKKCEVLGKTFDLENEKIKLDLRIV